MDPVADYYARMYVARPERDLIWAALVRYIQKDVSQDSAVLDLGAGYCSFINQIICREKFAIDLSLEAKSHASPKVKFSQEDGVYLKSIPDGSVDVVFASNFFEHLTLDDFTLSLANIHRALKRGGRLILLQPNFYYCYREYFHDSTHRTVFTHVGMADSLETRGFEVVRCVPRLVPMSMQSKYGGYNVSRLPLLKHLVRLYLNLPYRPMAKQMYFVCNRIER